MDSIEKTLTATQNLLCALEHNPTPETETNFFEKINFLRESHKITTKFLEEKCRKPSTSPNQRFLENATYHSSPGCTHYWSDLKKEKTEVKKKQFTSSFSKQREITKQNLTRPRIPFPENSKSKVEKKKPPVSHDVKEKQNLNNQTVPKPFKFLTRKPLGNTYSRKFLDDMLLKKEAEKEQEKKMLESMKPFKANPIPSTTYISNNKFVYDPKYLESIQKLIKQRLSSAQQKIKSKSCADLRRISSRPVPLTTYISTGDLNKLHREQNQARRATNLLKEAQSPPGIKEHSIKTNIAFRLRHKKCLEDEQKIQAPKKVPDFKALHKQIPQLKSVSKTTLVVPFNFSEIKNTKHRKCRSATPSRRFSANPAPIPSHYDHNTYKTTLATQLRLEATRNRLSEENSRVIGGFWSFNNDRMKSAKNKLMSTVNKSQSTLDISKKAKEKRLNLMSLTHEYNLQLKEMQERVLNRPLIMEMQTSTSHKNALDRKFKNIMENAKNNTREKPSTSDISNNTFSIHREISEATSAQSAEEKDDEKLSEERYKSPKKRESSNSSSFSLSSSTSSSSSSSAKSSSKSSSTSS